MAHKEEITNLEKIFAEIEGRDFWFEANMASGSELFRKNVTQSSPFLALSKAYDEDSPKTAKAVKQRLISLCNVEHDPKHEHPYDTAIAAYILILCRTGSIADIVEKLEKHKTLFWARFFSGLSINIPSPYKKQ